VLEDEGSVYRIIILKKMRSAKNTLLYLSLSHSQKSLICQKKTPFMLKYGEKAPSAVRKFFGFLTYEFIKDNTTG
jgi:hypothetical protein